MSKYQVTFRRIVYAAMHVEADSPEEAADIAQKRIDDDDDRDPKFDDDDFESGDWEQMSEFGAEEMEQ